MARRIANAVMLCLVVSGVGCQQMSHSERGTLAGAGAGGLLGGIIGHQSGNTSAGAVLGTIAGGLTGALIGDAEDARDERDAVVSAYYSDQAQRAQASALTNVDLTNMAQNGLSDEVIINAVQTRGGRFDLSPNALIALTQSGVSDRVIVAIQKSGAPPRMVIPAATSRTIVARSRVVVVHPVARVGFVVGSHHDHRRRHHGRRHRW